MGLRVYDFRMVVFLVYMLGSSPTAALGQSSDEYQSPGCADTPDRAIFETSMMLAGLQNNGHLIGNGANSMFSIPKEAMDGSLSSLSIWVAGSVAGERRVSANVYFDFDSAFRPGLYEPESEEDACRSRKMYRMTRDSIERFRRTGEISQELRNWPWDLGAPVVDGDGNPFNYNLEQGDVPALYGDAMVWWVMHDDSSRTPHSLDLEVRGMAYVLIGRGMQETTLFLKYSVVNKGEQTLDDARFALFATPDITDDAGGTDTTRAMVYAYGVNEFSSTSPGLVSPAVGLILMDDGTPSPDVYSSFIETYPQSIPDTDEDYLLALDSKRSSGFPIVEGSYGIHSSVQCPATQIPVRIMYPGDPVTQSYWSMENLTGEPERCSLFSSNGRTVSDVYYMLTTTAPRTLPAGEAVEYAYAISWARGRDRHDSILKLRDHADVIRENSAVLLNPTVEALDPEDQIPGDLLFTMYPNPTAAQLSIKYSIPSPARIRIRVFDVLGRIMAEPVSAMQQPGTHSVQLDVSAWAPGAYFIRYELANRTFIRRLVVM